MDERSIQLGIKYLWQKHKFIDGSKIYNNDSTLNFIISIPWAKLSRNDFIKHFNKILNSHFFALLFKGDFAFFTDLIKKHNISFADFKEPELDDFGIQSNNPTHQKTIMGGFFDFIKTIIGYRLF